ELQLPIESVDLVLQSTATAPFDTGSSASRVTYVMGTAVQRAAADARKQMSALAAEYLGCPETQVALRDGAFVDTARPACGIAFNDLAARAIASNAPVAGHGEFQDFKLADTPSFAALVAEVQVDAETGAVRVLRMTSVCDLGTVLNPVGVRGQLEGGLVQGLGLASMEEVRLAHGGRVETVSLADYKLPTSMDAPVCAS